MKKTIPVSICQLYVVKVTRVQDHIIHKVHFPLELCFSAMVMASSSTKPEIAHDISPYLIEYSDGTIERQGTERVPPGFDPQTGVTSKDIIIIPETGVSARIYRPTVSITTNQKLPLVLYFHGGAFVIASPALPYYHNFCNSLVGSTNAVLVSVDYRRAPEHPLPAAFDDAWAAIQWVAAHAAGDGPEGWLNEEVVDYNRLFLAGDSAGATMVHHIASQIGGSGLDKWFRIEGIILIHPYFWGRDPIGSQTTDPRRQMVDRWWLYVCPSDKGCDDPLINPFSDGAPGVDRVICERMLVLVADNDVLKDRGRLYYDAMSMKREKGKVEFYVTQGKDHVFHIFDPGCDEAIELRRKVTSFIS